MPLSKVLTKADNVVYLKLTGFRPVAYNKKMLDTLVLEPHVKRTIQSLTRTYLESLKAQEALDRDFDDSTKAMSKVEGRAWSADYVKGKGEGLIFLLHGKPGVGKTYTAGIFSKRYLFAREIILMCL